MSTKAKAKSKAIKTLWCDFDELRIDIPCSLRARLEPPIVPVHHSRWASFVANILSLYARGMTEREISGQLQEMYGIKASLSLTSLVTDAVTKELEAWRTHRLDALDAIVSLGFNHVKTRHSELLRCTAVHLPFGFNVTYQKEILGPWIAQSVGTVFWLKVLMNLKFEG